MLPHSLHKHLVDAALGHQEGLVGDLGDGVLGRHVVAAVHDVDVVGVGEEDDAAARLQRHGPDVVVVDVAGPERLLVDLPVDWPARM